MRSGDYVDTVCEVSCSHGPNSLNFGLSKSGRMPNPQRTPTNFRSCILADESGAVCLCSDCFEGLPTWILCNWRYIILANNWQAVLYTVFGFIMILMAALRRARSNEEFFTDGHGRYFRTSGRVVLIASVLSLALYVALFVLILYA